MLKSRWFALAVLCAQTLMIVLDQTIVNVALPSIRDDLGFTQSSLAWVINAYLIAFGGLLLLTGRTDDLVSQGVPTASALTSGYHLAFWIGAALVAVAGVLAAVVLGGGVRRGGHARAGARPEVRTG